MRKAVRNCSVEVEVFKFISNDSVKIGIESQSGEAHCSDSNFTLPG